MSAAKERPILFSGPMIRALLDGSKRQTRRVVKGTNGIIGPLGGLGFPDKSLRGITEFRGGQPLYDMCPYGVVGDRLWVRETWYDNIMNRAEHPTEPFDEVRRCPGEVYYRADGEFARQFPEDYEDAIWRPSIFMPRWASRLTLTITDVRVERLQEISADDAMAEGLKAWSKDGKLVKHGIADPDGMPGSDYPGTWPWHEWRISPVDAYEKLWDSLNAKRAPWSSNPWVWVLTFSTERAS